MAARAASAPPRELAGLAPGATVGGKYRLLRRIGAGGMGEVWAAENRDTGAEIAVKMARSPENREDSAVRFRREARLAAMLGHRGVVRIFDLVDDPDGGLVLVMELLHGETLERYMQRRGPLPIREAIAIALPVLAALAHAHDAGIVHRDVTPANVFLAIDPDGHVTPKLLDFGLAKVPAAGPKHTVDGRALGTPRYMAPERIREQDAIDGRSDLFSMAVILYELVTGVCPFAANSPAASLAAVLEVVVDPDARIEPRVWLELRRALSKRPYERPATALAMASALLAASGETETSLSETLRQLALAPDLAPDATSALDGADAGQVTKALGGHSIGTAMRSASPRRRALVSLLVGLAVGVGVATLATLQWQPVPTGTSARPSPDPDPLPAVTAAPVDRNPAASEIPSLPASAPTPPAPGSAATPSRLPVRPGRTPIPTPIPTSNPKRVAITPGF
jgi:serine/threonine protein kinase